MLSNLARLAELSDVQNMETPSCLRRRSMRLGRILRGNWAAWTRSAGGFRKSTVTGCTNAWRTNAGARGTSSGNAPRINRFKPNKRGSDNEKSSFEDSWKDRETQCKGRGKRARSEEKAQPPAKKRQKRDGI